MRIYIVTQYDNENCMVGVAGAFPTQNHALAYTIQRVIEDNADEGVMTDLTEAEAMRDKGFPLSDAMGYEYFLEDAELRGIDQ